MKRRAMLLMLATLLIAGCDAPSTATDDSAGSAKQSVPQDDSTDALKNLPGQKNVTIYVAGMNDRLNIF